MSRLHLTRPCYTLDVAGKDGELTMYGEIVESRPIDSWTGNPVDGEFIILQDFLADLDTLKDLDNLTIHINSVGGDAGSSIVIHNRLRQLAAKKTCIVDGVAMSGGSLIMCACDHTVVYPSSIVLWHHAWGYVYGDYNAPELRKLADQFDGIDKSQTEIYMRKTGKSLEEITGIMDDERYLTGREAYEAGLADELIEEEPDVDIAASADRHTLFVQGRRIAAMGIIPDSIKTVEAAPGSGLDNTPEVSGSSEEGGQRIMTLDEFRTENPELAAALLAEAQASANAEAANAERKRIADIDAIASLFDDATVKEAKYGAQACTAQEMAYRAAIKSAEQGKKFLVSMEADYRASGADNVTAANASEDDNKPMSKADMVAAGKAAAVKVQSREEG